MKTKSIKECIFYYSFIKQKINQRPEENIDLFSYSHLRSDLDSEWTSEDHELFVEAIKLHKNNFG